MANLWVQSFGVALSHIENGAYGLFDYSNVTQQAYSSVGGGRRGGGSYGFGTGGYARKDLATTEQGLIIGLAFNRETYTGAWGIFELKEGTNSHLCVRMNADFTVSVVYGGLSGTVLGTSSRTILPSEWVYIELKSSIHPTNGSFELRMNGVTQASGSGLNTRNASSSINGSNYVFFGNVGNTGTSFQYRKICDVYINNTTLVTGSACHDFLGPVRVEYLPAAAEGFYKQFTPSSGTNRAAMVDDVGTLNSDNNSSGTAGHMDSYTLATLPAIAGGSVVYAVQQKEAIAKTDAGYLDAALILRDGTTSTDNVNTTVIQPSATDKFYTRTLELNPFTTVGWTSTDIANLQVGIKVVGV